MVKKGYKETEIGVIPKDWEINTLEPTIGKVKSGKRLPKGYLVTQNITPHPYIRVIDMKMGMLDTANIMYVPDEAFSPISQYRIYKDDLYISVAGTLGLVGRIPEFLDGANLTENANRITDISCDVNYLLYWLMGSEIQKRISDSQTLGAQPKLALYQIRNFPIPTPRLEEQQKIAEALSDMDSLVSSLEKLIEKKKSIKQGAMQELLTGGKRLPGFSGEWKKQSFGKLCTICRGGSPRPIQNFLTNEPNGVNWIKIGDVGVNDKYINSTAEKIKESGVNMSRRVYKGDFILSNSMSFGRPYILNIDGCIHDGWLAIQDYQKAFNIDFLYYLLSSNYVFEQYIQMAAGSSVQNLNKEKVAQLSVYVPTIEEQNEIALILSDIDEEITALEQKLSKCQRLKQGMMQQLLTGKIRLI